jgi:hypothetical protein
VGIDIAKDKHHAFLGTAYGKRHLAQAGLHKGKYQFHPGKLPQDLKGNAILFDDPMPSNGVGSELVRATLRVKNKTNFNWIAYTQPSPVLEDELKTKKLRNNFYQQIQGKRIELYLDWYDANNKFFRRNYAGHLVGNVPKGQYGTFVFEYSVPDELDEALVEYNLILPDDKMSLTEVGYKPYRRSIKIYGKDTYNQDFELMSFKKRKSLFWRIFSNRNSRDKFTIPRQGQ